jgi:transposase
MDIEQSNELSMSGRGDGGALVRVERRRNWSDEEKLAILKETTAPGAIVSAVARRHSVGTGQLYTWRKQLLRGAVAGFVPVELASSSPSAKAGDPQKPGNFGAGLMTSRLRGAPRASFGPIATMPGVDFAGFAGLQTESACGFSTLVEDQAIEGNRPTVTAVVGP